MSEPVLLVLGLAAALAFAIVAKRFGAAVPDRVRAGRDGAGVRPRAAAGHDRRRTGSSSPSSRRCCSAAGWQTDWVLFRANLRPILQLAIGLVVVSTVASRSSPSGSSRGWAGPARSCSARSCRRPTRSPRSATFERFAVPRRIVAVLEGEGLVNDATALVIYGYAVAAVVDRRVLAAAARRVRSSSSRRGGVAVGFAIAWVVERLRARSPIRAERLADRQPDHHRRAVRGVSRRPGAARLGRARDGRSRGSARARRSSVMYRPETRLIGENVWTLWIYAAQRVRLSRDRPAAAHARARRDRHALALLPAGARDQRRC